MDWEDDESEDINLYDDPCPMEKDCMDTALINIGISGDIQEFNTYVSHLTPPETIMDKINADGGNILHVALVNEQYELVKILATSYIDLCHRQDTLQNLPIHYAASQGSLEIVKSLLSVINENDLVIPGHLKQLLGEVNSTLDSPLHVALANDNEEISHFLLAVSSEGEAVTYKPNNLGKTPFYIAAEKGFAPLVQMFAQKAHPPQVEDNGTTTTHVVFASILSKNLDTLQVVLAHFPLGQQRLVDGRGRTPLSLASSIGFLEGVVLLMDSAVPINRHVSDNFGDYPIHHAARYGHVQVIEAILKRCPDTVYLTDSKGRTFLHVAARSAQDKVIMFALSNSWVMKCIQNRRDKDGNTVLHIAVQWWHPYVVRILTVDTRIKKDAVNNRKMTALDIAEANFDRKRPTVLRERLTWQALALAKTRRVRGAPMTGRFEIPYDREIAMYNAFSVILALIVGFSYSAYYTFPGGFESDGTSKGYAIMLGKWDFKLFTVFNFSSFASSVVGAILLVYCYLNDSDVSALFGKLSGMALTVALVSVFLSILFGLPSYLSWGLWISWLIVACCILMILVVLVSMALLFLPMPKNDWRFIRWIGGLALDLKIHFYRLFRKSNKEYFLKSFM